MRRGERMFESLKTYHIFTEEWIDSLELDFFAYTYEDGKCSCCHDVYDLSEKNWRGGLKKMPEENPKWMLFNNADNLVGEVNESMFINAYTFIRFSDNLNDTEQLTHIVNSLQQLLGDAYKLDLESSGLSILFVNDRNDTQFISVKEYNEAFRSECGLRYYT